MIFWTIAFMVVFGTEDEDNYQCLICYTANPKYQVSCCGKKLCSECLEQMKDKPECPNCRQFHEKQRVPDWKGEEKPLQEMSQEEQKKAIKDVKNKQHLDLKLKEKQMKSRMAMQTDEELGEQFIGAAEIGDLEMLDTILGSQSETRIPDRAFGEAWWLAAKGGHLETLKYLRELDGFNKITVGKLEYAWVSARLEGTLEVLEFLSKRESRFDEIPSESLGKSWILSAYEGNYEVLQLLSQHKDRVDEFSSADLGDAWASAGSGSDVHSEAKYKVLEILSQPENRFDEISSENLGRQWIHAADEEQHEILQLLSQPKYRFSDISKDALQRAYNFAKPSTVTRTFLSQLMSKADGISSEDTRLKRFL